MLFGWKEAGETLRAGGLGIAQSVLQEGARKKEEERLIERERRGYEEHIKRLDAAFKRDKDLHDYKKRIDAEWEAYGNNIDMRRLYEAASKPDASAEVTGLASGVEKIRQKQHDLISLSDEDYPFIERVIKAGYPGVPAFIYDVELKNARLAKQLEASEMEYKTQLDIRRAREKELSLARKLEAENKRLVIEGRKREVKEEATEKLEKATDVRDKAMGKLVELLGSKGLLQYDKASRKWLARQFTKRESVFNEKGEIVEAAKIAIIKKHPEFRPYFSEIEKLTKRVEALGGIPEEQAEISAVGATGATEKAPGVVKDERGLIVGKIYEDEDGRKARYLGSGQWEIIPEKTI